MRKKIKKIHYKLCHNKQHCECCARDKKKLSVGEKKKLKDSEESIYELWSNEEWCKRKQAQDEKKRLEEEQKEKDKKKKCGLLWCCRKIITKDIPLENLGPTKQS